MRPVEPSAAWEDLPAALQDAIQVHSGPVLRAQAHGAGLSTRVRLLLHTASGDVFIKGTSPASSDEQRRRLALGARLAPYLTELSPPLLFRAEADGWHVTG